MKDWGFVKDPIHGYVRINETERALIDTRPVQRLRRIRQLAGSEYVYPAANHTRFEHVLGTMYLAGILGDTLPTTLSDDERQELKIAALLHDIGHGPFSHVFEPVMVNHIGKTHEDMTPWLVNTTEISTVLRKAGHNPTRIAQLAVGRLREKAKPYLDQIISSSIDVDKMDFLVRDSFHTGAGYGSIDVYRLIYTMDVLNGNLAVDGTAVATLESFLLARLESFRTIYFHRASRAVQIMLVRALEAAADELGLLDFEKPEDYLSLDDYSVWTQLRNCGKSREIMEALELRRLLKCSFEKTLYASEELASSMIAKQSVRDEMQQEIARRAKVPVEEVIIDVPSLPSVPYHHTVEMQPFDIPIFLRLSHGRRRSGRLAEISKIDSVLRALMNLARVYTAERYRERVGRASRLVLGEESG